MVSPTKQQGILLKTLLKNTDLVYSCTAAHRQTNRLPLSNESEGHAPTIIVRFVTRSPVCNRKTYYNSSDRITWLDRAANKEKSLLLFVSPSILVQ